MIIFVRFSAVDDRVIFLYPWHYEFASSGRMRAVDIVMGRPSGRYMSSENRYGNAILKLEFDDLRASSTSYFFNRPSNGYNRSLTIFMFEEGAVSGARVLRVPRPTLPVQTPVTRFHIFLSLFFIFVVGYFTVPIKNTSLNRHARARIHSHKCIHTYICIYLGFYIKFLTNIVV